MRAYSVLLLSSLLSLSSANAHAHGSLRLAKRSEIIAREWAGRGLSKRVATVSPPVCDVYTDFLNTACCPANLVYDFCPLARDCCNGGVVYPKNGARSCCNVANGGTLYTTAGGTQDCCYGPMASATRCCDKNEVVVGDECASPTPTSNEVVTVRARHLQERSFDRPAMVRHDESARTLLSAELVAQHLTNNGLFSHNGQDFVDEHHQAVNEQAYRRVLGKGLGALLKYVYPENRRTFADVIDTVKYVPLSNHYEFAVADVPEIYARIVADDDFESLDWGGVSFDRAMLRKLASGHPNFNASLVNDFILLR